MTQGRTFASLIATVPLIAACAMAPPGLHDGWRLQSLAGAAPPVPVTLSLDASGRAAGAAPCNRYFGAFTATAEAMSFGAIASTKRACPALGYEAAYLDALSQVTGYRQEADRLVLTGQGRDLAVFTRHPPAAQDG